MGDWKLPLWGCFDDIGACAVTYVLPCVTSGKVAESVGMNCLMYGILSVCPIVYGYFRAQVRQKVASKNGIDESFVVSFLISCFIPLCGIMQERAQVGVNPLEIFRS
eukprot:sb/3477670/